MKRCEGNLANISLNNNDKKDSAMAFSIAM
jgi:hypothetical protein